MSERYNRPRTPPGPPPTQSSRKPSTQGRSSSATSTKPLSSKSYGDRPYSNKYDKMYAKPSSSYQSSKPYADDKYDKSASVRKVNDKVYGKNTSVRKVNEKVGNSKYVGKSDAYGGDVYKAREVSYPSSDRYNEKDHAYMSSSSYPEKGRYPEKYPASASYGDKFSNKKFADSYDAYPEKTSRYPRLENEAYYGSAGVPSSYDAYDAYGSDRHGASSYGIDKRGGGLGGYVDKYGGKPNTSGYGGGKHGGLAYGGDKAMRGEGGYGGDKHGRGMSAYAREDLGSAMGYGDKLGAKSRMYPEDDRRPYRDYSPPRPGRAPLPPRGIGGSYGDYDRYSPPPRSPERQYLNRYVIGDSVVYGPPGQYPRELRLGSPRTSARPPSPPSPQSLAPRNLSRYPASPRRYGPGSKRTPPGQSSGAGKYRTPSPVQHITSPRRPPSPHPRRPPSPRSPYHRSQPRNSREESYEHARSKERYSSKANISSTGRSPIQDSRGVADRRDGSRVDRDKRKEPERRIDSRERTRDADPVKRGRLGDRNSDYHNSSDIRSWSKDGGQYGNNQTHQKDRLRDERRPRSPLGRAVHTDPSRDRRREEETRERDRSSRRLEDRLGPSPASQGVRRSPLARPRLSRRAASPRDKKRSRRPDDLRLWIESRKSEGGKRPLSPNSRSRPLAKRAARSSDRALVKRSRLGDPKKRLRGGYKARRRTVPRSKILKKYQRLTSKRGAKSGRGNASNRSNKENNGKHEGGEGGDGEEDSSKPGSTATIRRVIKKPKKVSDVNCLALKPRVIRKPTQKLLKDPKEVEKENEKSKEKTSSQRDTPPQEETEKAASTNSDSN